MVSSTASSRFLWMPFAWALLTGGLAFLLVTRTAMLPEVALWALVLAAGSLVVVPAFGGNRLSLAFVVAAAMPLLLHRPADGAGRGAVDLAAVGAVYAIGLLAAWLLHTLRGEPQETLLPAMVRFGVGAAVYATVFVAAGGVFQRWLAEQQIADLVGFVAAALLWFGVETFLWAFGTFGRGRISRRYLLLLAIKDWPVSMSLLATGALFALTWEAIGPWWAVLVATVPYAFAHLAFHRYQDARRTYAQTIRALARIPEAAGLSPNGHSDRTAAMAVAVAREVGLTPDEVTELQFAGLLHDIGRITLNEPSILKMGFTDEDLARWGAEIVAEAPYLERVASIVQQQHQPYRRPGEERDPELPMASKIIRAASAYDHATVDLGFSPLEALEVLHRGAAYDFDPDVVQAVRSILQTEGTV